MFFDGFDLTNITTSEGDFRLRHGGSGPPLLLLHGNPQTHAMWHKVAPELGRRYTVIAPDLRGYGGSMKPPATADHAPYAKTRMARDMVELMEKLGHKRFQIVAHDRGARVAHRLAMDHPQAVKKLMLLDISPTLTMYEQTSMDFAKSYWWWFWLIQPAPFPESMVAGAPEIYLKKKIGWGHAGLTPFTDETYAAYLSYVSDPATMHAMCEDYRAAASVDLAHDRADRAAGRKIACPVNVIWGEFGVVNRCFKPLEDWRAVAGDVRGRTLPCGHYIPEEVPEKLLEEMMGFFL